MFIVSFDYTYGNTVFFTKRAAMYPEIYNDPDLYSVPIASAAEASSAAPFYFDPKQIADHTLVDGGIIANNPSLYATEYASVSLKRKKIRVISIGTALGPAPDINATDVTILDWMKQISSLVTTPEQMPHTWTAEFFSS